MTDAADNPELLSLRYVDIDTLAAWDRNAKKHDFGALVESIVRHGFRDPPAYDSALNAGAGGVAEGNGRADALRMMRAQQMQPPRGILLQDGRWFAPVLFGVDSASQAAAEAYAVAHNNLTMAGGDFTDLDMSKMWDSVGYADLLADLARQGESPVTIDESALDALLAALAPLPEIGQGGDAFDTTPDDGPTRTALGELWLIGGVHRLLVGDCTDAANVARLMDGERAALCFTSPPYNVAAESSLPNKDKYRADRQKYFDDQPDNRTQDEYLQFLVRFTSCALDCADYVFVNVQSVAGNKTALIKYLYELRNRYADTIIWDKLTAEPAMAHNVLNSRFEYIHVFSHKANRAIGTRDFRGTLENVYMLNSRQGKEFSDIHRATFPLELPLFFVEQFTNNDELVYEPFAGTGTTLIAAHRTNRRCYGLEIEPRYADVILKRAEAENLVCELISE